MTDPVVKSLVVAGLLVQATAVGLGFTSLGWRWPIAAAGALVSLGFLLGVYLDGGKVGRLELGVIVFNLLVLGLAVAHAFTTHPAVAGSLRVGAAVQALALLLLLAFLLFFKMNRLF